MEKAVVRRGIGAVVLALVAALLLGYLLKGKGPERKEVVNMELPKSPIQIFPEGSGDTSNVSGNADSSGQLKAAGIAAAGSKTADAVKEGAAKVADSGKKIVGKLGKHQPVDGKTGNPALEKSKVIVDGSGQAIYGAKTAGVKNTPANFEFRTPNKREVRPSIQGRLTATAKTKSSVKKAVNAKLVGEKKLPPVGKRSKKDSTKIASSRNKSSSRSSKTVKKTQTIAKTTQAAPSGRNKYVVQLLATSNASKANSLKATMSREGYPAYVSKTNRGGKTLYRVRVGSYSGKSSAIKKQATMKRRYRKNPYIQSSIVVRN